jgi:hypothetical protein
MPLSEAHSILWFMGVFLALWGLTLVLRGVPRERVARLLRLRAPGRAGRGNEGDWRLIAGGLVAILVGVGAFGGGIHVYTWRHQIDDLGPPLWASAALGAAAFFVTLLVWAIRGQRTMTPRCPVCLYDTGASGSVCPECGFQAKEAEDFLRPRRRKKVAVFAAVLLLLTPGLLLVPSYQRHGAVGLVPATVQIAGLGWWPGWMIYADGSGHTLEERYWNEELPGWQMRWLERRAARLAASKRSSPATALRGMRLMRFSMLEGTEEQPEVVFERLLEILCDPQRTGHDELLTWEWWPWYITARAQDFPDVISTHANRLAALLGHEDPSVAISAGALLVSLPEYTREAVDGMIATAFQKRIDPSAWAALQMAIGSALARPEVRVQVLELLKDERPAVSLGVATLLRGAMRLTEAETSRALEEQLWRMVRQESPPLATLVATIHMYESEGWLSRLLETAAERPRDEAAILMSAVPSHAWLLESRMPELVAALGSANARIRAGALDVLEGLVGSGTKIDVARPHLQRLAAEEREPDLRARAAALLGVVAVEQAGGEESEGR